MYYIQTWNQRGDFQPATLGGRRFFRGVSFRTGHPLPISMDFKGFPMFGQKPEGSQLPQTSQTLEFRNLRRWRVIYIYIHLFPFNLQPPKTNGWNLKIAFGKFQPLVFGGGGVYSPMLPWFTQDLKSRLLELQRLGIRAGGGGIYGDHAFACQPRLSHTSCQKIQQNLLQVSDCVMDSLLCLILRYTAILLCEALEQTYALD